LGGDGRIEHLAGRRGQAPDLARGDLGILRLDRRNHVTRHQRQAGQTLRIEPDPHRMGRSEHIDVADAGNARQGILDVRRERVGHVHVGALVGVVIDRDDQQRVGVRLGDANALLLNLLRQAADRLLDLVLHLHLGNVGVGPLGEYRRDADRPARARRRAEIEEIVDPDQLLLDDLGDAVLDRLRRGAGVAGADIDLRRRDVGILFYRQRADRAQPGEHDNDRQHPC
jgi:hypothetical protein